jgi:ubiquinone/menaquinone biosynthesis C-methylase UbiE
MIKTLLYPFKKFAWFKRLNAKVTYELLAKHIPAEDWHFMNYGYDPNTSEAPLVLSETPTQRYPLQMYHYLAAKAPFENKEILEVGSGRGGGARHLASYYKPTFYTGMDLAHHAVDLANQLHKLSNLKFIQGSAEQIPIKSESVDIVINVESCHAYGSVDSFLKEVKRVLKPGGHFLMVDFRYAVDMPTLKNQLATCGLTMLEEENITPNVIKAIEQEDDKKKERIKRLIPTKWQKLFSEFAGVVGSKFYNNLKDETRFYYRYVMVKNS